MSENVFLNTTYAEGCIRSLSCPWKKNLFLLYLLQARCWNTVFSDDTDREGWGGGFTREKSYWEALHFIILEISLVLAMALEWGGIDDGQLDEKGFAGSRRQWTIDEQKQEKVVRDKGPDEVKEEEGKWKKRRNLISLFCKIQSKMVESESCWKRPSRSSNPTIKMLFLMWTQKIGSI